MFNNDTKNSGESYYRKRLEGKKKESKTDFDNRLDGRPLVFWPANRLMKKKKNKRGALPTALFSRTDERSDPVWADDNMAAGTSETDMPRIQIAAGRVHYFYCAA